MGAVHLMNADGDPDDHRMCLAPWLLILLTVLSTARLTRLVTSDTVTAPLRRRLVEWRLRDEARDDTDWLIYLAHCRWCASVWVAVPVAVLVWLGHGWPAVQIGLIAASASMITGLLVRLED